MRAGRGSIDAVSARAACAGALLIACFAAIGVLADTLHVIELRHRPAAEIQPLIHPLLRADEGISGSGYQLYLRATAARHAEIARLVAALDVAARQLTVTLRHAVVREERRARDAVSGEAGVGGRGRVVVPDADASRSDGARGGGSVRYRFERRSSNADESHTQVLRVQDGSRAFIRIGDSVPVVERVLGLTGRRAAVLAAGIRFEEFTTGFDLLPRVHGDIVQLELTPRLSARRRADGTFQFQELRTTVTARLGEWVDLGTFVGQSSEVNRAILQSARTHAGERTTIMLKVE